MIFKDSFIFQPNKNHTNERIGALPANSAEIGALPATPTEPIPVTEEWRDIKCDATENLKSHASPGPERWKDADANTAWAAMLADWESYKKDNPPAQRILVFTDWVADYFHATPGRNCERKELALLSLDNCWDISFSGAWNDCLVYLPDR